MMDRPMEAVAISTLLFQKKNLGDNNGLAIIT